MRQGELPGVGALGGEGARMSKCVKDGAPCLHAPCVDAQGVRCCAECPMRDACTTACFKAKEARHDDHA